MRGEACFDTLPAMRKFIADVVFVIMSAVASGAGGVSASVNFYADGTLMILR